MSFASVTDRLARDEGASVLSVPPTTVRAPWSGLTPPRDGWEPVGQLDGEVVDSIARQGISQVAEGTPANAGGHAVDALRRRTWGAMSDTVPPIAAGLAFGAHVLGFTAAGEPASIAAHGRWTRLSTAARTRARPLTSMAYAVRRLPCDVPGRAGRVGDDGCQVAAGPRAALDEHVLEHVDAVADEAVDAEVEQRSHLVGVVDGPDVHLLAVAVGRLDETRG